MGKAGKVADGFAKGATRQQLEFARALRQLHQLITEFNPKYPTAKSISKYLNVTEQHVSNYLHAERPLANKAMEKLFRLAEKYLAEAMAADSTVAIPFSLDGLRQLRELAIKPCKRCRTWHDAVVAKEVESTFAERPRADAANGAGVPVPLSQGDRHLQLEPSPPPWTAIEEVRQLSESGLEAELLNLLGHVGASSEPDELPSIMHALHSSGLDEAADAVVSAAATRPAKVVLEIALELHDSGLRDAVGRLLSTARTSSRG